MVTFCLEVVRTFSVLYCAKMCKKFCRNCSDVECTKLRTSSTTPGTCGGKISLFILKNSDANVCSYEKSVWWTNARLQHYFPLASAVHARAGLCITEAKAWETDGGLYWDNGEYNRYDACRWWFLIATTDNTRWYFTNHREKNYSLFFTAISIGVYAYAFTGNVPMGVLLALAGRFFYRWCNQLWVTCCFFYFFDLRRSRLVKGLVSLLKTQPL